MVLPIINLLPIRFHSFKVLPLVYTESLSYYEDICKCVNSINETIEAVNNLNTAVTDISNTVNTHTSMISELATNISVFEANVNKSIEQMNETLASYDIRFNNLENELKTEIDNNIKALREYVDATLVDIEAQIDSIVQAEIQKIIESIDKLEQDLRYEFETTIRELIATIPDLTTIEVISPVSGKLVKVQTALDDVFMNTRYYALTIDEFNGLHLSINDCNTMMYKSAPTGWSIITWLSEAKRLLNKNPKELMFGFINGVKDSYKKNIELNNTILRVCGCLNCNEFVALNISVDAFNEIGATCEELAWSSNRLFA